MTEIRDPSREEFAEASLDASFGGGSDENTDGMRKCSSSRTIAPFVG
jgi:hypothetical protein